MTCGERIRREREKRKMSQEDLAERMNVSRQAVGKWETDRSRPTREKLERLSALFLLPPEVWQEELPERAALRRWKAAAAVLAALLCLTLAAGWALRPRTPAVEAPEPYVDTSYMFPGALPLTAESVEEFGSWPLATGNLDAVSEARERSGDVETVFVDQFPGSSWLEILRADPVEDNHTTFYGVYARYILHVTGDTGTEPVLLGRLTDSNHYVGSGLDGAAYFTNVLGHEGWKITLTEGAACVTSWYFCMGEDGVPYVLLEASGSGAPVECDVDGDGEREVVTSFGLPMGWTVYDTAADGRCVAFTLDQNGYGGTPVSFSAEEGFTVTDSAGTVMARYLLAENRLVLQPQTDFSLADYPDAAGTELTFTGDDPDRVLYNGTVRVTPRQQAYLALQELYAITGLTVDRAYCAAEADGTVSFSVDPAGEQVFFRLAWGPAVCGAAPQPGCTIVWQSEAAWSPLEDRLAARPETGSPWPEPEETLAFCYRRLNRLAAGELMIVQKAGEEYRLCLSDGSFYRAELSGSGLLRSISGPCPANAA
ncbi:helix-turn-helix transcriptional regulator [Dysosmobacter sp.]|uniref:helix-turn-helix transcriptional regulator n=1 Tax=Dysosmobacter sp. TaxID=2591382 RepID=UPI002A892657|nr:helix-turn-helix transcriptional regulator [Dysosmobacter sp.]MDY3281841.1 helix-turn-helix transcriptional regulator [Dysosmobacter sp.]